MLSATKGKVLLVVKNNSSLLVFTFLNYFDKFVAFSLPLIILYLVKDVSLYNNIEYVLSVASLVVVLIDLGLKSYFLYGYSQNPIDSKSYIENVATYFYSLFFLYSIIGICLTILTLTTNVLNGFMPFIIIRVLVLFFISFFSIYYRLIDKPQNILFYSIFINLLTIVGVLIYYKYMNGKELFYFFIVQLFFLIYIFFKSLRKIEYKKFRNGWIYIKKALVYSWPLILNVLIVTFINNYGKIYAFHNLSEGDMYSFSYVLRFAMIIQMAHVSVVAFYSKALFTDRSASFNFQIYKTYNLFIFLAIGLMFGILFFINNLGIIPEIPVNFLVVIILSYVFLWCQQAFFEQYLNKLNKNKYLLLFSVMGSGIFILMLAVKKDLDVNYIALSMLTSVIVNICAVLYFLKKLRLI